MGLINFFKKMFNKKVITLPNKRRDVLVQPLCSGYTKIDLGQKLVVDSGWSAVIVAKDEVLDVFMEGTYELSLAYLPKTAKELKLDKGKVVKNGVTAEVVLPKSFKCDLYFVHMEHIQGRKWESELIKVKEKDKKNLKYQMRGNYSFQVQAPNKVIELFLIDWAKIKTGKSIQKLDVLVSDACTEILWKKKYRSKDILTSYDFANQNLKNAIYKNFIKYGICITDMQVEHVIYPESFKGESFQEVTPSKKSEISENNDTLLDINKIETQIEVKETKELIEKLDDKPKKTDDEIKPNNQVKNELSTENVSTRKIPFYTFNSDEKNENYKTPDTLSVEAQTEIICPHCQKVVPKDSKFCNHCGNIILNLKEKEND